MVTTKYPVTEAEKKSALKELAERHIYSKANKSRFVDFGMLFWGKQNKAMDILYVGDWIRRFNQEEEYIYADKERTKMLIKVDGVSNAKKHAYAQMKSAGWSAAFIKEKMKEKGL
jgi:hypothetical protein